MNAIIGYAMKFSGFGFIWDKVDGYKTYIAASLAILTGLLGVVQEVSAPLLAHNGADLLNVLKSLPHDQSWLTLVGGFGMLGVGHSIKKMADPGTPIP